MPFFALCAIAGGLVGWASWLIAARLTPASDNGRRRHGAGGDRAVMFLCVALGGSVVGVAALRSGGELAACARVAVLAAPLLISLATDARARLVFPLVLTPGVAAALGFAATSGGGALPRLLSGLGAGAAMTLLVWLSRRFWAHAAEAPLGSGDILLAGTIGAMLGPERTPEALFAGMILGAIAAGALLLSGRAGRGDVLPYGVFLSLAALAALATQPAG